MTEFVIETIADRDQFLSSWKLSMEQSDAHFFSSYEWLSAHFVNLHKSHEMSAVYLESGAKKLPIAYFHVNKRRSQIIAPSSLSFMETGDTDLDRVYPEYIDFLGASEGVDIRAKALLKIFEAYPNIDEFVFRNITSTLCNALKEVAKSLKFEFDEFRSQPTFQINLQSTCTDGELLDQFSKSLRAKIRRSIREYEKRGELQLRKASTPNEREQSWNDLVRLHESIWQARGQEGAFKNPLMRKFHEALFSTHPAKVDFVSLSCGGDVIGVLYNFIHGQTAYNYQSGFKLEANNKLVPGFTLHSMAAEYYAKQGLKTYDLLAGDAEYKRRLGEEGQHIHSVVITRPGLVTNVRAMLKRVKGAVAGFAEMRQP